MSDTLLSLHKTYLGAQDKGVDVPNSRNWKHDLVVKETRMVRFEVPSHQIEMNIEPSTTKMADYDDIIDGKKHEHTLSPAHRSMEAYTNFRVSPASAIESVALTMGAHREVEHLRLFKHLGTDPVFYQMSEGRAIPALSRSPNSIKIITNKIGPVDVSYDVVSSLEDEDHQGMTENTIYAEQYAGTEELSTTETKTKLRLNFNHPIVKIYLFTNAKDVEDARILLDGHDHGLILEKVGDHYEFTFGHGTSVNFSRVQNQFLLITTKTPAPAGSTADIFAIHKQVVRRMNGVASCA